MARNRTYPVCALVLLATGGPAWSAPAVYDDAAEQRIYRLLRTTDDLLPLVREHWPQAQNGDVHAMVIAFNAINNCSTFESAFRRAESIDDLDALLSTRHPRDREFAKGIYFKCKGLVERLDEFPGWRNLRLRATR